jgi:hypothetical protein
MDAKEKEKEKDKDAKDKEKDVVKRLVLELVPAPISTDVFAVVPILQP